jgi:hypothetical protein
MEWTAERLEKSQSEICRRAAANLRKVLDGATEEDLNALNLAVRVEDRGLSLRKLELAYLESQVHRLGWLKATTQMKRHRNGGLRKLCDCPRRTWAKCPHSWYLNFKPKDGPSYRLSLDRECDRHIESRTEAETEADRIRREIRAGTFRQPKPVVTTPDVLAFEKFGAKWIKGAASVSGRKAWKDETYVLARIGAWTPEGAERFGLKPIGAITEDDFEALRVYLRSLGRASNTWNHYLQVLKSLSRWGVKKGYLTRSRFGADSDLKRERPGRRNRRLAPGEEAALLAHANPQLQRLIIAALETGCRLGELLSLQWADVSLARGVLCIRAENAKDREARELPISARLRAVLEMGQTDPAG